jgi:hypothetical protein
MYLLGKLYEVVHLGVTRVVYYTFRIIADIYLSCEEKGDYKLLENEWEDMDGNEFKMYKVKSSGHIREFVMTNIYSIPKEINWDDVIQWGNEILACLIEPSNGGNAIDITEELKKFSPYILYNDFITVEDFVDFFNRSAMSNCEITKDSLYNVTVVYSDLDEKQIVTEKENLIRWVLLK